jgi:hypothetical protein
VKLGELIVPDLSGHQMLGNYANRFSARLQHRIGDGAHQADISASIDEANFAPR